MVKASVAHLSNGLCATFLFLPHFDAICDLLLNRHTVAWKLFFKLRLDFRNYTMLYKMMLMLFDVICDLLLNRHTVAWKLFLS